jgi:hypothetical protein
MGQGVPHAESPPATAKDLERWTAHRRAWAVEAQRALDVKQCLAAVRSPHWKWS